MGQDQVSLGRRRVIGYVTATGIVAAVAGFTGGYFAAPPREVIKEEIVYSPPPKREIPKEPIKINEAGFQTGAGVLWSKPNTEMINVLAEYLNTTGGILGRSLTVESFDAAGGAAKVVDWVEKQVSEGKVDLYFSNAGSGIAMAVAPVLERGEIIALTVGTYTIHLFEDTIPGAKFFFRIAPNDAGWTIPWAIEVAKRFHGKKVRIAALFQDYAPGRDSGMISLEATKRLHGDVEVVYEAYHPVQQLNDFTPYISAILAAKPDVLFWGSWGGDAATCMAQMKASGVYEKISLVCQHWQLHLNNTIGREYPEGVFQTSSFFDINNPGLDWPLSKWLFDFTLDKLKRYPSFSDAEVYVGLMMYKTAVELAYALKGEYPENKDVAQVLSSLRIPAPTAGGYVGIRKDKFGLEAVPPIVVGYTKIDPRYGIPVLDPTDSISPEKIYPPPDVKVMDWVRSLKPL